MSMPPGHQQVPTAVKDSHPKSRSARRRRIVTLVLILVAGVGIAAVLLRHRDRGAAHRSGDSGSSVHAAEFRGAVEATKVEVVTPRHGGIQRTCDQPGTVEPFESADLYAKVSGFLEQQNVDIGSHVHAGDLLVKISVPELEKQVARDEATVAHEQASVQQAEAKVKSAEAEAKAAQVGLTTAETVHRAKTSYRKYREKQLARLKSLNAESAIEAKVVDESQDYYESAVEAEAAAKVAVAKAQEDATAAVARIALAQAELAEKHAAVLVAEAELQRSRVLFGYSEIRSPYDGVITKRTFYRGAFIRAADSGGTQPALLSVERTDRMRVIVYVPDRDVPYVKVDDPAELHVDALPGHVLKGTVSRMADSEDPGTRTMRTEVDVDNPDRVLRTGMFGHAVLRLASGSESAFTIPSSALVAKGEHHQAKIRIVHNGKVQTVPVEIGTDNGINVEVLAGLQEGQKVVINVNGTLQDNVPVEVIERKSL
ncbi:MAG: efflux RND transporter periplasmic adaptor subunit [Planctomycetaceae bacterium]